MSLDSKIYFGSTETSADALAHERIGSLYAKGLAAQSDEEFAAVCTTPMGIDPHDQVAQTTLRALQQQLSHTTIEATANTGIYFIKNEEGKEIAVFKVGRKRASMEIIARRLAHLLGLEKHMIPTMFAVLNNPPFCSADEETVEELWNGKEKVYTSLSHVKSSDATDESRSLASAKHSRQASVDSTTEWKESGEGLADYSFVSNEESDSRRLSLASQSSSSSQSHSRQSSTGSNVSFSDLQDRNLLEEQFNALLNLSSEDSSANSSSWEQTACAVVGTVQPFLDKQPEADLFNFALLTIFALALGLRDGKKDGMIGSTWFDIDDCMHCRLDPSKLDDPAALDLPYLDNDRRTDQYLTLDQVAQLNEIVSKWNILDVMLTLSSQRILFHDSYAEEMDADDTGIDEGGCTIRIESPYPLHIINGELNHLDEHNPDGKVLLSDQSNTCMERLIRIKDFIKSSHFKREMFTPQQLVDSVDPYGCMLRMELRQSPRLPSPLAQSLRESGQFCLLSGRYSPSMLLGTFFKIFLFLNHPNPL
jgi:hypothetical protein